MQEIIIVPVGFFQWNEKRAINNVYTEIEPLDPAGAISRLTQPKPAFHTFHQLMLLLRKADRAGAEFKFTDINVIYELLKHVNRGRDQFSHNQLARIFARIDLSPTKMRELFRYFPELTEQLPYTTLQTYAVEHVLLAEHFSNNRHLAPKLLHNADKVYEDLIKREHFSLWWYEQVSPYGLATECELAFADEKYLSNSNVRNKLSEALQQELLTEVQNRRILEQQIKTATEELNRFSWYQWREIYKIKNTISSAQQNINDINNKIKNLCVGAGVGKDAIAQRALDVFLRRQHSASAKHQCWENFQALKSIRPKYSEVLDKQHVEALLALADSPEKFLDVVRYLCGQQKSRKILAKLLETVNIFSLQASLITPSLSQVAAAADHSSRAPSANRMYESILPLSNMSELHDTALQNIKCYLLNGTLIKEEDSPLGEEEWGDNFGARYLSNYPLVAEAIYAKHPQVLANDIKNHVRHPDAIIRFVVKNHRWLTFEHLVYISTVITNQKARNMFLNLDFVKEKLRRGVDDIIVRNPITPDKNELLVKALRQNDVREAVNLTRQRHRNENLYNQKVVELWINHSLTDVPGGKKCHEGVAKIIASDSRLLGQIRAPIDSREFKDKFILTNEFFAATHDVHSTIESYRGWFSSGKDEFIQEFIKDLKAKRTVQSVCYIVANDPDLFQRLKDAYIGKRYFWGLFGVSKLTIKAQRAKLKQISEHFKEQLEREEKQNKIGHSSGLVMSEIDDDSPRDAEGYESAMNARRSSVSSILVTTSKDKQRENAKGDLGHGIDSAASAGSFSSSVLSATSSRNDSFASTYNAHGLLADKQNKAGSPAVGHQEQPAELAMESGQNSTAVPSYGLKTSS